MFNSKLTKVIADLACAVDGLGQSILECRQSEQTNAILRRIDEMEKKIMSKVSEFAAKQNEFNDRVDTAVTGLQADIQALNDKIEELQNSPGEITPEDQASLDALQARGQAIADKLEALDALTPPVPPPAP